MKKRWFVLITPILLIITIFILLIIRQQWLNFKINDDYSGIYQDIQYKVPVNIENIGIINQKISCGYACIELLSSWNGESITETELFEQNNGKISTAFENGFEKELNKQISNFHVTKMSNLKNTDLIYKAYKSIEKGIPVPFQFSAIDNRNGANKWTLHYAVITGMDIKNNSVTISNPYGYVETYSIEELLNATTFKSYENMEFPLKFLLLTSVLNKNTIYIMSD